MKMLKYNQPHSLTTFDKKYIRAQTKEHNVLSENGHVWEEAKHGQTRHCTRCWLIQCTPPYWVPIPHTHFSKTMIEAQIAST